MASSVGAAFVGSYQSKTKKKLGSGGLKSAKKKKLGGDQPKKKSARRSKK